MKHIGIVLTASLVFGATTTASAQASGKKEEKVSFLRQQSDKPTIDEIKHADFEKRSEERKAKKADKELRKRIAKGDSTVSLSDRERIASEDSIANIGKATFESMNTTVKGWGYGTRLGMAVGGTSPFPLPEEIREIKEFGLNGAFMQEFYGYHLFNERFGLYLGERIAYEGMKTTARVKNYQMSITQDGEEMSGYYTGIDETNASTVSIKIPIEAMIRLSPRWDLRVGPYMQFNIKKSFGGSVYDGYIRVGDPTGQKVDFGPDTPAVYDFSDQMKTFLMGAELGADCKFTKHFGAFAHLDWGMSSIFPSDFETITFKMFPIYFSLGLFVGI